MTLPDSAVDGHAVRMNIQQWQFIDATIDNEISIADENGDSQVVDAGSDIRQAGWDQLTPLEAGTGEHGDWPPGDQEVAVALPAHHWAFVLGALDNWASLSDEQDEAEAAGRKIRDLVAGQLPAAH